MDFKQCKFETKQLYIGQEKPDAATSAWVIPTVTLSILKPSPRSLIVTESR